MNELRLNDVFWTLQGEGANWGRRALFVRMPFCNLACSWCDTSFNSYKKWSEEDFVAFAKQEPGRFAVITGGEPTINKQTPRVIELLKGQNFEIAIESNGTFPIPAHVDFATVSPKRDSGYDIHPNNMSADEFKYVVDDEFDFSILDRHQGSLSKLSLSPEFTKFNDNVQKILAYIKEHPEWRLSLQTHKWLGIP
jgi:7-carboxy-7-deazaguanine synthase